MFDSTRHSGTRWRFAMLLGAALASGTAFAQTRAYLDPLFSRWRLGMRVLLVSFLCLMTSGCAYYLTPRPPVMERKLGRPGQESVGALATAADYRIVYAQINPDGRMCAEPPPDAAGQFAAIVAAKASGPLKKQTFDANAQASMALSMKQLFQRSQGVQFYRDATFALCNLYMNKAISPAEYVIELRNLHSIAAKLIETEIPYLQEIEYDPIASPSAPPIMTDSSSDKASGTTEPPEGTSDPDPPTEEPPTDDSPTR